jgi:hypothetical protein
LFKCFEGRPGAKKLFKGIIPAVLEGTNMPKSKALSFHKISL